MTETHKLTPEELSQLNCEHRKQIEQIVEDGLSFEMKDLIDPGGNFCLRPMGDRIFTTLPLKGEDRTTLAGISVGESDHYKDTARAEVLAVGPGLITVDDDGHTHRIPVTVNVGDWILFPDSARIPKVRFLGVEFSVVQESAVLAIIHSSYIGIDARKIAILTGYGNPAMDEADRDRPGML